MRRNAVTIRDDWRLRSAPRLPVRGHQLGFRNTNNTYDLWTVADYERYIRDLAVFGANTIEVTGDGAEADNGLYPVAPPLMHQRLSRLAQEYGLDFSVWLPATKNRTKIPRRRNANCATGTPSLPRCRNSMRSLFRGATPAIPNLAS